MIEMPRKFTSQQKEALIAQFYKSKLSQTEFCKAHKIPVSTLGRWMKKLDMTPKSSQNKAFEVTHSDIICDSKTYIPSFVPLDGPIEKEVEPSFEVKMNFKIHSFELEVGLDFLSCHGQKAFKNMLQILTQVSSD